MIKIIRQIAKRRRQRLKERDHELLAAYLEGRKAERKAIAQWLRSKAYLSLSDVIRGRAHLEGDDDERSAFGKRGEEGPQA